MMSGVYLELYGERSITTPLVGAQGAVNEDVEGRKGRNFEAAWRGEVKLAAGGTRAA